MITTSLLARGLDFSSLIKHIFIVNEPRNMIDFLRRAEVTLRSLETFTSFADLRFMMPKANGLMAISDAYGNRLTKALKQTHLQDIQVVFS